MVIDGECKVKKKRKEFIFKMNFRIQKKTRISRHLYKQKLRFENSNVNMEFTSFSDANILLNCVTLCRDFGVEITGFTCQSRGFRKLQIHLKSANSKNDNFNLGLKSHLPSLFDALGCKERETPLCNNRYCKPLVQDWS